jgi:hypothetical protein
MRHLVGDDKILLEISGSILSLILEQLVYN